VGHGVEVYSGFVICSACGKVLAVEPKRERNAA